jgi:hypothetical protein
VFSFILSVLENVNDTHISHAKFSCSFYTNGYSASRPDGGEPHEWTPSDDHLQTSRQADVGFPARLNIRDVARRTPPSPTSEISCSRVHRSSSRAGCEAPHPPSWRFAGPSLSEKVTLSGEPSPAARTVQEGSCPGGVAAGAVLSTTAVPRRQMRPCARVTSHRPPASCLMMSLIMSARRREER